MVDILGVLDVLLAMGFFVAFFVWLPIYGVISIIRWMARQGHDGST